MKTLWELPGARPKSIKAATQTARFVRTVAFDHGLHYKDEVHLRAILNIIVSLGFDRARGEKVIEEMLTHRNDR